MTASGNNANNANALSNSSGVNVKKGAYHYFKELERYYNENKAIKSKEEWTVLNGLMLKMLEAGSDNSIARLRNKLTKLEKEKENPLPRYGDEGVLQTVIDNLYEFIETYETVLNYTREKLEASPFAKEVNAATLGGRRRRRHARKTHRRRHGKRHTNKKSHKNRTH